MFPSSLKYLKFIWPLRGWKPLHLWVHPRGSLWPVCLKMSKEHSRFYSGKVKNNRLCTTGFSFWIVKYYLFSFNYGAIMFFWNTACRFHYNFSLNWMFVNVKVSTVTCGMKQKHNFYINLILLFPPILTQSGFLDMLNLLQWFPWQLLFIVVPPRTPIIRKPNFAKGSVFAFLCLAFVHQTLSAPLLLLPASPSLQSHPKAGSTRWDVIKVLWLLLQPTIPFWSLLHIAGYCCVPSKFPSERWASHSCSSLEIQTVILAVVSKPTK